MSRCRLAFAIGSVLAFIGCSRGDTPSTAPSDALAPEFATSCPDEICGPSDGIIHDRTGNGSLPSVAGDPSPGAPGLWLGNMVSARWCYADYNFFVTDRDQDWLDDECEYQLAKAFAPVLVMSPSDGCPQGEPYWSAKYVDQPLGRNWGESVRIAYMPAYYKDCGKTPHAGDSEFLMIQIHENNTTRHWQVREAYLSAHAGTPNPGSEYIRTPTSLEYPLGRSLAFPRIWIARGKHGHYRTQNECQSRAPIPDNCSNNTAVGRLLIHRSHNTGSRFVDNFPSGVASTNPLYAQNGRREFFYAAANFAGWQPNAAGVTPYHSPIFSFRYECFDYTYAFGGGTCYFGPGSAPPTARTLTGVIDGATSVTGFQTYTWTSFVTGGRTPYRAEWSRRYASATAATLVGTSTGTYNGVTSTAGSWTGTVDRCENFTLTLKILDADNRVWTDNHAVTLASCPPPPPPPLSVGIAGPELITVKAKYTYTAFLTNFSAAPTYTWSERFCDNTAGTACSAWVTITGLGATFNRVLGPDCGPLKQDNFQVRVVVRNVDGRTATGMTATGLCLSANPV